MNAIASLSLATAAFVGTHLLMSHPLRAGLVSRLGGRGFQAAYSVVAFATLGWMILAWRSIEDPAPLWVAPLWWWRVGSGVMLLALVLLAGSFARNPAFPHPGGAGAGAVRPATGVFAITRHPMNWSFILWALVHISVYGTPRNLIVAGGILVLAVAGSIGQDRKKLALEGDRWREWMGRTSFLPFAAVAAGKIPWRAAAPGLVPAGIGLLLWLAITWYHAPLVAPLGGFGGGMVP